MKFKFSLICLVFCMPFEASSQTVSKTIEITKHAMCSGLIIGNAYIDFVNEIIDRDEFEEVLVTSQYPYLESTFDFPTTEETLNGKQLSPKFSDMEQLGFDSVQGSNRDQIAMAVNSNTFGSTHYESIISCYQHVLSEMYKSISPQYWPRMIARNQADMYEGLLE